MLYVGASCVHKGVPIYNSNTIVLPGPYICVEVLEAGPRLNIRKDVLS